MCTEERKESPASNDTRAKFREALQKKNERRGVEISTNSKGPKSARGQSAGNVPKMFRRKAGSA